MSNAEIRREQASADNTAVTIMAAYRVTFTSTATITPLPPTQSLKVS